jgi:aspartate/methionine/tyrosine aminotransferase
MNSRDFALHLLQESRVAVAPGTAFGTAGANFVRVSLATAQDQLVRGVERLCDTIDECATARP